MRILHVVPWYEPAWRRGGVVRSVSQLCRGLAAFGADVTVYTTDSAGDRRIDVPRNCPLEIGGVKVVYYHADRWLGWAYSGALADACFDKISDFDLVHIASIWNFPGIVAGLACRLKKVPYIESTRGSLAPFALKSGYLRKWLLLRLGRLRQLKNASAIHYTVKMERKWNAYLGLPNPSFVVPNGLDLGEFDLLPSREEAHQVTGVPVINEDDIIVTYLGRLHSRKGLDVLVNAFSSIAARFSNAYLVLAGPDDGFESQLRSLVSRLGLANKVFFPGFIHPSKRAHLFAASDLFALPAHQGENFGNAVVEAMAAGLPVLVSDQVGISQDIQEDQAGRVVGVDKHKITEALGLMLSDPDRLDRMGSNAYKSARCRYSIEIVARRMAIAYEDVLTGRRSSVCEWSNP